jgi:Cu-Zn family superoxide dismutase
MKRSISRLGMILIVFGSQWMAAQDHNQTIKMTAIKRAIAVIIPTRGAGVHGTVVFEEVKNGVHVSANLIGLSPGRHGFHIHEFGDISSEDGSSAGGHYNPMEMSHSAPASNMRHMGDMGNITADTSGKAQLDYIDTVMKLEGQYSIIGRSIVVHANEDDLKTQPTGNAGARIGYGIIGIAK